MLKRRQVNDISIDQRWVPLVESSQKKKMMMMKEEEENPELRRRFFISPCLSKPLLRRKNRRLSLPFLHLCGPSCKIIIIKAGAFVPKKSRGKKYRQTRESLLIYICHSQPSEKPTALLALSPFKLKHQTSDNICMLQIEDHGWKT